MASEQEEKVGEKRAQISRSDILNVTLENSLKIVQAIWDNFAGKGSAPHNIAHAIDLSPTSSVWHNFYGSYIRV